MNIFPIWMPISPLAWCASDVSPITDTLTGGTTISALTVKIYLGSTDKTTGNLTGSQSFAGNVYTTKSITGLLGGNTYVLVAAVTIDGVTTTRKCEIRVQKDTDTQ